MNKEQKGVIILYQTDNGKTKIEVCLENENVWLSKQQMAELRRELNFSEIPTSSNGR
jgi:hypothetical protein